MKFAGTEAKKNRSRYREAAAPLGVGAPLLQTLRLKSEAILQGELDVAGSL